MNFNEKNRENNPLLPQSTVISSTTINTSRSKKNVNLVIILLILSTFYLFYPSTPKLISIGGTIEWTICPDSNVTYCGYHEVPMDWTSPDLNKTISIALRMLPATAPKDQQLGNLLINPGGPGGSGHNFVLRAGNELSIILDHRYNIIGWDPRSVNLTTGLNCFHSNAEGIRFARDIEHLGLPFEYSGKGSLLWAKEVDGFAKAMNGACQENTNNGMLESSSTAFVVRDIVSILGALGSEKLNYWGFSYGTILGATFSAMFPDLVQRVLLDGVSDSNLYTNNLLEWGQSGMEDTHKTWQGFVDSCAESGPLGCSFALSEETTAKEIQDRFDAIMIKLRDYPLSVYSSSSGPGILTSSDLTYAVFHMLYSPKTWPAFAKLLAELETGNGTALYEMQNPAITETVDNPFHRKMSNSIANTAAIMCGDSDNSVFNDSTTETFLNYANELASISPSGEIWAVWVNQCKSWASKSIETYRGPWTKATGLRKTNFPVLFLTNTADPVTPESAARSMSKGFGADSASLLIQNGFGHCSLAHPSIQTAKIIRAYFLEGIVPEYGKSVKVDPNFLFPHKDKAVEFYNSLSIEDQQLYLALDKLSTEINRQS